MRFIPCIIAVTLLGVRCVPDALEARTYRYTVKNESGVPIETLGFHQGADSPYRIYLKNDETLTQTHTIKSYYGHSVYDFRYFFASSGTRLLVDSLKVIFNKQKYALFVRNWVKNRACDTLYRRDPLNLHYHSRPGVKHTFVFRRGDYLRAKDCNGPCQ